MTKSPNDAPQAFEWLPLNEALAKYPKGHPYWDSVVNPGSQNDYDYGADADAHVVAFRKFQPIWATWRLTDSKRAKPTDYLEALRSFFSDYNNRGDGVQPSTEFLRHGAKIFAKALKTRHTGNKKQQLTGVDLPLGLASDVRGAKPLDLYLIADVARELESASMTGKRITQKEAARRAGYTGSLQTLRKMMTTHRAKIDDLNTPHRAARRAEYLEKIEFRRRQSKKHGKTKGEIGERGGHWLSFDEAAKAEGLADEAITRLRPVKARNLNSYRVNKRQRKRVTG